MMNKFIKYSFVVSMLLLVTITAFGQSASRRKALEKKTANLKKEISYTQRLLGSTKKNKLASMGQLLTINKQIDSRKELIKTIHSELSTLDKEILKTTEEIEEYQTELDELKAEYAKMIYYAYKTQNSYNRLMFVFAASDFDQAFMRLRYLQQYSSYRHKQAEMIVVMKESLTEKLNRLEEQKGRKGMLLSSEESERLGLVDVKKQKEQVVSKLQQQESELKAQLAEKRRVAANLQTAIQKVIAEELAKVARELERKKKAAGNTTKTPKLTSIPLAPEALALSAKFELNKGKLPWPVSQGIIVGKYGIHTHPVMKNIKIKNSGIDIKTADGLAARSVFGGEVKAIVNMPGAGKFVLIRHGEYLTIYSNLSSVSVKVGDMVKAKQSLGLVAEADNDGGQVLHFELWKGTQKANPELWISK